MSFTIFGVGQPDATSRLSQSSFSSEEGALGQVWSTRVFPKNQIQANGLVKFSLTRQVSWGSPQEIERERMKIPDDRMRAGVENNLQYL